MAGKNNLTMQKLVEIAKVVEQYTEVVNKPDKDNNIMIIDGKIRFIYSGKIIKERDYSTVQMMLDRIAYDKNVFDSSDIEMSPLAADKKKGNWDKYYKCDFMKFMPQILLTILFFGIVPDMLEAAQITALAYTEIVQDKQRLPDRNKKLKISDITYKNIGAVICFSDGRKITNHLLRFKDKYADYIKTLPYNEFTTEMLFNRIFKVFGSCIRDIYNPLRLYELKQKNVVYSLYADLDGIDMMVNNVPVYAYSNTVYGTSMRSVKVMARHPHLRKDIGINIVKSVENKDGLHLFSDELLLDVVAASQAPKFTSNMSYTFYG